MSVIMGNESKASPTQSESGSPKASIKDPEGDSKRNDSPKSPKELETELPSPNGQAQDPRPSRRVHFDGSPSPSASPAAARPRKPLFSPHIISPPSRSASSSPIRERRESARFADEDDFGGIRIDTIRPKRDRTHPEVKSSDGESRSGRRERRRRRRTVLDSEASYRSRSRSRSPSPEYTPRLLPPPPDDYSYRPSEPPLGNDSGYSKPYGQPRPQPVYNEQSSRPPYSGLPPPPQNVVTNSGANPPARFQDPPQWPQYTFEARKGPNFGKGYLYNVTMLVEGEGEKVTEFSGPARSATFNTIQSSEQQGRDFELRPYLITEVLQILESSRVSGTYEDAHDSAILTSNRGVPITDRGNEDDDQFWWKHLNTDSITWEAFQTIATQESGLSTIERSLVIRLLEQVSRTCEKQFVHGRFMEPTVVQYRGYNLKQHSLNGSVDPSCSALFLAMPYFSLGPPLSYPDNSTGRRRVHRPRALLQSRYKLESTERMDGAQVVCQLKGTDFCIHVPQLWAIVLDRTIITCAPMKVFSLGRDHVTIETLSNASGSHQGARTIRLLDTEGQKYYLPVKKCQTWNSLTMIGQEYRPIIDYMYTESSGTGYVLIDENGDPVSDHEWAALVQSRSGSTIKLSLEEWNRIPDSFTYDEHEDNYGDSHQSRKSSPGSLSVYSSDHRRAASVSSYASSRGRSREARERGESDSAGALMVITRRNSSPDKSSPRSSTAGYYEYIIDEPDRMSDRFSPPTSPRSATYTREKIPSQMRRSGYLRNQTQSRRTSVAYNQSELSDDSDALPAEDTASENARLEKTNAELNGPSMNPTKEPSEHQDQKSDLGSSAIFTWPMPNDERGEILRRKSKDSGSQASTHSSTQKRQLSKWLRLSKKQLVQSLQGTQNETKFSEATRATKKELDDYILLMNTELDSTWDSVDPTEATDFGEYWAQSQQLFSLIVTVVTAFVPENYDGPLVDTAWGSVKSLAGMIRQGISKLEMYDLHVQYMIARCKKFRAILRQIQSGVSGSKSSDNPRYYVPKSLLQAFQDLLMFLCLSANMDWAYDRDGMRAVVFTKYAINVERELRRGKDDLIAMVHTGYFGAAESYREVDTMEVTALIMDRLIKNSDQESGFELIETYREYMSRLEREVLETPSVSAFDKIQSLVEELSIIDSITAEQLDLLTTTQVIGDSLSVQTSTSGAPRPPPSPFPFKSLSASAAYLRTQRQDIAELLFLATQRKRLLTQTLAIRKESNGRAILIFTVITVVFLPLSFVASYLGMNSVDIRNAGFGQGRFWEVGVPVTIGVLLACVVLLRVRRGMKRGWGKLGGAVVRARERRRDRLRPEEIDIIRQRWWDRIRYRWWIRIRYRWWYGRRDSDSEDVT